MNFDAQLATNTLQNTLRTWKNDRVTRFPNTDILMPDDVKPDSQTDSDRLLILEDLCQKGADLKHLEKDRGFGCIPHVFWCQRLMKFFVDRGSNVNSADDYGDTALHLAIRHVVPFDAVEMCPNNDLTDVIEFLLEKASADPKITNLRGENVFFTFAQKRYKFPSTMSGNISKVEKMLIERGGFTDCHCNNRGQSILHVIKDVTYGVIKDAANGIIDSLIKGAGTVDVRTHSCLYSLTPLMVNARFNVEAEICQTLIEKGADLNAQDLQGYTALHHALFENCEGLTECADTLVSLGADTNVKSETGRDCYDVAIFRDPKHVFTYGATPKRQAEIYEMAGAVLILRDLNYKGCFKHWKEAKKVYRKFKLEPSAEFLENFEFLQVNRNNSDRNSELQDLGIKTVARLSPPDSIFWNFFASIPKAKAFNHNRVHIFKMLQFLSAEFFERIEEFASFDERDIFSLCLVVNYFNDWLVDTIEGGVELEVEDDDFEEGITPEFISLLHSIARLTIASLKKITEKTNSKKLMWGIFTNIYVTLCHALIFIHFYKFSNVILETQLNENKQLLRKLVEMDLRDKDSNSLLHLVIKCKEFEPDLVCALLDDFVENVKTRNDAGFEPIQVVNWNKLKMDAKFREVVVKMADKGSHIDARNQDGDQPSLVQLFGTDWDSFSFPYDTLQCACARVLATNLEPYANRVPKHMVDFINSHK